MVLCQYEALCSKILDVCPRPDGRGRTGHLALERCIKCLALRIYRSYALLLLCGTGGNTLLMRQQPQR